MADQLLAVAASVTGHGPAAPHPRPTPSSGGERRVSSEPRPPPEAPRVRRRPRGRRGRPRRRGRGVGPGAVDRDGRLGERLGDQPDGDGRGLREQPDQRHRRPVPATGVPTAGATTSGPPPSADPPPTGSAAPTSAAAPSRVGLPIRSAGRERPAVAPASASSSAGGPTVRLSSIGHVAGQAVGPGEIAGPAIRVSIVIENRGSTDLDLAFVAVNAYIGADRRPAGTLTQPAGSPFGGVLKPGERATGVYLFTVPTAERDQVTLVVDYLAGQPAAVFTGAF